MVKHIVMFKLAEKNAGNLEKAVNALKSLEGNIEELRFLEVGVDYQGSERSYDIVLTTHFDARKDLEIYRDHKNHKPVAKIMRELCSNSAVVDYEVP